MDPISLTAIGLGGALAIAGVWYVRSTRREAARHAAVHAKSERLGLDQPVSLHPRIDLERCICTGACIEVCPEKDVLGWVDAKPALINPSACIGHGECLCACPVDAIDLVLGSERRGVDIPNLVDAGYQTNVPGMHVAGELGGMGLIHNAINQGQQAMRAIVESTPPREGGVHQVLIIGAGPAGIAAGLAAKEAGLDYALVEQEELGGAVRSYPRQKIVMTAHAHLPLYGKVKLTRTTKEALLELWREVVAKTGLTVETGVRVTHVERKDGVFAIETSKGPRRAQRVLLAIGRRGAPRKLGVPGEELDKVAYKMIEPEQYRGGRCLVVGGGDAAVETALALAREPGTHVTLCHRGERFDRVKPDNRSALDAARAAGQLEVRLATTPSEIRADEVVLRAAGETVAQPNDWVFVCIGGELPTKWLATLGVEVKTMRGEKHPAMQGR